MIIYKAENTVNGKIYIGCTTNTLEYRKGQHNRDSRRKTRPNTAFTEAILRDGIDNFVFTEIDTANSVEQMYDLEEYYIEKYKSLYYQNGYNLTTGGKSGKRFEYTGKKMSDHSKKNWANKETSEKMLAGLAKGTKIFQKKCQDKRIVKVCPGCGIEFEVYPKSNQKYCSRNCSNKNMKGNMEALELANKKNKKEIRERHSCIKEITLDWAIKNKEIVEQATYNKVTSYLKPLTEIIYREIGQKDIRPIAKAVCGTYSKKELLKYLKEYVKIYAEPDRN